MSHPCKRREAARAARAVGLCGGGRSAALWAMLLLLLSPAAWAGETLLVMDVSESMATTCPAGDDSLLSLAIARVREHLDALPRAKHKWV